jgi:hypothetical protein
LGYHSVSAQLKVGNNATSINSNANVQVESNSANQFVITKDNGNVGIGTLTPNVNAQLEVNSASKGLLLPRVALSATNNPAPLTAHVQGMVVYNTATASSGATAVSPGFYTNDGTKWDRMSTSNGFVPSVVASASIGSAYTINDNSGLVKCRMSTVNINDGGYNNVTFEYTVGSTGTYNLALLVGYLLNNNSGFNAYTLFAVHANSSGATIKAIRLAGTRDIVFSGAQSSPVYISGSTIFRASVGDKFYFVTEPCSGCVGSYTNVEIQGVFQKLSN